MLLLLHRVVSPASYRGLLAVGGSWRLYGGVQDT